MRPILGIEQPEGAALVICPVCGKGTVEVDYRYVMHEQDIGMIYRAKCVCGAQLGVVADEKDVAKMVPIRAASSQTIPGGGA